MERARPPGLTLGLTDREGTLLIRTYGSQISVRALNRERRSDQQDDLDA